MYLHRSTWTLLVMLSLAACGESGNNGTRCQSKPGFSRECPEPSNVGTGQAGQAIGAPDLTLACEDYCRSASCSNEYCQSGCESLFNATIARADYIAGFLACDAQHGCDSDDTYDCRPEAREGAPVTERGQAFCADHGDTLDTCFLGAGLPFGCLEWTQIIADSALAAFKPCLTYHDCDEVTYCIDEVIAGYPVEPFDQENSCDSARDGVCDGPDTCERGTDSEDCEYADVENSCRRARNGRCDEPDLCEPGTDTEDCTRGNTCTHAFNGVCDSGCYDETDVFDCSTTDRGCPFAYDGLCDEPSVCAVGSDWEDCGSDPDCARFPWRCPTEPGKPDAGTESDGGSSLDAGPSGDGGV
jgi:hypothetical protein